MDNLKKFAFGSITFFALLFIACENANSPQESTPFVAGTWTGREVCPPYDSVCVGKLRCQSVTVSGKKCGARP